MGRPKVVPLGAKIESHARNFVFETLQALAVKLKPDQIIMIILFNVLANYCKKFEVKKIFLVNYRNFQIFHIIFK
jgi:hypothetical protein